MDRFTKVLLALIAAGLWANVAVGSAIAQNSDLQSYLFTISREVRLISEGTCNNKVLC